MSKPLYELTADMMRLQLSLEDGELTPETEAELASLEKDFTNKAPGYVRILRHFVVNAEAIKLEEDRLKLLRTIHENAEARLKMRLFEAMTALGMDKFDAGIAKLSLCKNSRPTIKWLGKPDEIPQELRKVREPELDSDKALEVHKSGGELPSQVDLRVGKHIRIK